MKHLQRKTYVKLGIDQGLLNLEENNSSGEEVTDSPTMRPRIQYNVFSYFFHSPTIRTFKVLVIQRWLSLVY